MWITIRFYNIIIPYANVDIGGGDAYPQNVDKRRVLKPLPYGSMVKKIDKYTLIEAFMVFPCVV